MRIPIEQIRPSPFAVRPKPMDVAPLAQSIRKHGQLHPIKVRPVDGGYECVYGNRRLAASEMAGLSAIEAIIEELDDGKARAQIWSENEERKDLDDVSKGEFLERWMEEEGLTRKELSAILKYSVPRIDQLTALTREPEAIKQAIREGKISEARVRVARHILKDDVEGRVKAIEWAIEEETPVSQMDVIARVTKSIEEEERRKPKDEEWKNLPEVKELLEAIRAFRDLVNNGFDMADAGKFSPEARRFIARRIDKLIGLLEEWRDELLANSR